MDVITKFILASTAEHRKKLLATTGLKFESAKPADESQIVEVNPTPKAQKRSEFKALSVSKTAEKAVVLGADQVLCCQGEVFSKPESVAEARKQLAFLAGKNHQLFSGWALSMGDSILQSGVSICDISFRHLKSEEIESYLKTAEWRGSCGGYKYEGAGIQLMDAVKGDYSSIVGLPLLEILQGLRALKINPLIQPHPPWYL